MWLLAGIGAILAGVVLALRELLPWLNAQRSGVIRTRGARVQVIRRADEPERFKALARQRFKAAGAGLAFISCGLVWLLFNLLGLVAGRV